MATEKEIEFNQRQQNNLLRYFYNCYKDGNERGMKSADVQLQALYEQIFEWEAKDESEDNQS